MGWLRAIWVAIYEFFVDYGMEMLTGTREHMVLVILGVLAAAAIGVPLGIVLARCPWDWMVKLVLGIVNIFQPIPSLALVSFAYVLLGPVLNALGFSAMGLVMGLIPLVVYALLPILRNTFTGIRQVDATVIEVARGMGMKPWQVLTRIQLPLALPFIMTGLRIATVWTVGVATLVSLVGAGGLGDLIFIGLRSVRRPLIVAGALPAVVLALLLDWGLSRLEHWLAPPGAREQAGGA
jgi:osmoprotectant transport system permease protein